MTVFLKPTPEAPLYIALVHQQRRRIIMFKAVGVSDKGYILTVAPSHEYGGNSVDYCLRHDVQTFKSFDRKGLAELLKSNLETDCREYVVQTFYEQRGPVTVSLFKQGSFNKVPSIV